MSEHPIAARWRALAEEGGVGRRAALIPYLTAGFPTPAVSLAALRSLEAAGADFVEVGVPFSDPLADGLTIQRSAQAALDQGMTLARVLEQIAQAALRVPVVIMTYVNPVFAYGVERFLTDAAAAGAAGLLLTDVPAGADAALEARVAASPLALIRLIAPTTPPERLARAARGASGFLYLITRLGVTGARDRVPDELAALVARVRGASALPLAVGFGISTPAQARTAAAFADGVVVGSAIVEALGAGGLGALERLVGELAAAVRVPAAGEARAAGGAPGAGERPRAPGRHRARRGGA
ncbi:MAG TPA: tryptophan synthase subunit alpha [Gemmatimonadales bacterium]|nr:tryptophan synthase subunit alpha [Gemmatimonadales bacterium]